MRHQIVEDDLDDLDEDEDLDDSFYGDEINLNRNSPKKSILADKVDIKIHNTEDSEPQNKKQ